jgi:hypothetical protein
MVPRSRSNIAPPISVLELKEGDVLPVVGEPSLFHTVNFIEANASHRIRKSGANTTRTKEQTHNRKACLCSKGNVDATVALRWKGSPDDEHAQQTKFRGEEAHIQRERDKEHHGILLLLLLQP